MIYFLYSFLPAQYVKYVSFLSVYTDTSITDAFINTVLDIPLLYALFRLSQGKVYEPKSKKKKVGHLTWGMFQIALWGYSGILTLLLFILAFLPSDSLQGKDSAQSYTTIIMFAPLFIFWVWVIGEYKQYKWNWWRTTLVANALLYSGSIFFGLFIPQTVPSTTGFDSIGVLQLFILLISLYVFGKEQFV